MPLPAIQQRIAGVVDIMVSFGQDPITRPIRVQR